MIAGWPSESRLSRAVPVPRPGPGSATRRAALALLALGIALIAWFGLLSSFPAIPVKALHGRGDLLEHVCAFAYMSLVSLVLWRPGRTVVGLLVASAGILELVQIASPLHQPSLVDWAASSSGVGLGAALFVLARRGLALVNAAAARGRQGRAEDAR